MAGKITTILAKKEAETYRIQGLHKEALRIYRSLLVTSPNIDPALKAGIENRIDKISAALASEDLKEANRLTVNDIIRVRKGWGEEATGADMMICARAFHQIGNYKEALVELAEMLQKGRATEKTHPLVADCLVKLYPPAEVADAIEKLYKENFDAPEDQFHHTASVVEAMVSQKQIPHANAILTYLEKLPALDGKASRRLAAIADRIAPLKPGPMDADHGRHAIAPDPPPTGEEIPHPFPHRPSRPKNGARSLLRWLPFFGNRA